MTTVRVTHIGGPTVLIEFDNWRILTDPTFDDPGRTYQFALGTSSRKTTGPTVALGELGPIDVVLLTHDHHADNLDDAGRELLAKVPNVVTTASGAARLGGSTLGLEPWASTALEAPSRPTIQVTATPCRHGPPLSRRIVGDVVGFALDWLGQQHGQLWISGDTVLYAGVREVSRLSISLAILHLGGAHFRLTGPVRYTMTASDAVELCDELRPRTVVPVHYEGWSHFGDGRSEIDRAVAGAPAAVAESFRLVAIGEPTLISV
jgi:L-ascorbate metabolism protein UlaG (beta-lactamase superfamily)